VLDRKQSKIADEDFRFLDESNADEATTELIRWSDDGNSFIVLDEDKFAQNLVPELFKHSNYASFVRQLNMYGFHKKVGLSDNSMRASEKKSKSPSEYQNAYFKRGRPELLWLIQKPKNETLNKKRKKGKDGDADSGDDLRISNDFTTTGPAATASNTEVVTKSHYVSLQREVQALQNSQRQITQMLTRLRDENNQYIRQASTLVAQHERHENSINAILTFLATFYNRNMENGSLAGMFSGGLPNQQPQGNVVDVGDYDDNIQNRFQHPPQRRPLALFPAPSPASETSSQRHTPVPVSATSPSSPQLRDGCASRRASAQEPGFLQAQDSTCQSSPQTSRSPTIKGSPKSPDPFNQFVDGDSSGQVQNHDDMMNVIHNANSAQAHTDVFTGPQLDFDAALQHYQTVNGNRALTPQERDNMLNFMNTQSGASTPLPTALQQPQRTSHANNNPSSSTNNTTQNKQYQLNAYLDRFNANANHLDILARLQSHQDFKVQDLADRLQPLSPSGSIPGLALCSPTHNQSHQQLPPSLYSNPSFNSSSGQDFDINSFLNSDYFANAGNSFDLGNNTSDFNNNDFDFGLGGANNLAGGTSSLVNNTNNNNNNNNDASLFGTNNDEDGVLDDAATSPQTVVTDEDNVSSRPGAVLGSVTGSSTSGGSGEPSPSPVPTPTHTTGVEIEDVRDEEEGSARKRVRMG